MSSLCSVGKRVPKVDAVDKATGRSQYIQDMKLPGMLYGKILYSKFPHARIAKIDTTRARALPGVRTVITGEDVPEIKMVDFHGMKSFPCQKSKINLMSCVKRFMRSMR